MTRPRPRKAILLLLLICLLPAYEARSTSYYFPWAFLQRVGPVNALHDYWAESNSDALAGIVSLGYHAVKIWPTVDYLSSDLSPAFLDPEIDVIVLRPLQNATLETGCNGQNYFRWEALTTDRSPEISMNIMEIRKS